MSPTEEKQIQDQIPEIPDPNIIWLIKNGSSELWNIKESNIALSIGLAIRQNLNIDRDNEFFIWIKEVKKIVFNIF